MKSMIETPFGHIYVKLNGCIIDYECEEKKYYCHFENNNIVNMYLLKIDTTNMIREDVVFCGFEKGGMEIFGSAERAILLTVENEQMLLGICGYDTENWNPETAIQYSYELDETSFSHGFTYKIRHNPKNYENKFYESRVITLGIACVSKENFEDPENALYIALTSEIG